MTDSSCSAIYLKRRGKRTSVLLLSVMYCDSDVIDNDYFVMRLQVRHL
jgi:hypothetical protein